VKAAHEGHVHLRKAGCVLFCEEHARTPRTVAPAAMEGVEDWLQLLGCIAGTGVAQVWLLDRVG
jgi:hypothetical protein